MKSAEHWKKQNQGRIQIRVDRSPNLSMLLNPRLDLCFTFVLRFGSFLFLFWFVFFFLSESSVESQIIDGIECIDGIHSLIMSK